MKPDKENTTRQAPNWVELAFKRQKPQRAILTSEQIEQAERIKNEPTDGYGYTLDI